MGDAPLGYSPCGAFSLATGFRNIANKSINLTGKSNLGTLSRDIAEIVDRVLHKGAFDVEAEGKAIAQKKKIVDTGALINSIRVKDSSKFLYYSIGPNVSYAIYQEFGTRRQSARPFMRPALSKNRRPITDAVKEAIERAGSI